MELYVPTFQLKQVTEVLDQEGVTYKVTGKTSSLVVQGKETHEVTEIKAELLEVEVPALFEDDPRSLRAYRLPSGKRIILTDIDGNFDRMVEPPPGWER
ncbi:MAG: hypothetical protein ACOZFS_16140 [Thermodesulfobacteriota bacterium]